MDMHDLVAFDPGSSPNSCGGNKKMTDPASPPACILIVEGDTELWRIVVNYLEEQNVRTLSAANREEMPAQHPGPGLVPSDEGRSKGIYRFQDWELDLRTRRLLNHEGEQVPLTKGEYALLLVFLASPGRILTREHLLRATRVHGDVLDRSIDVQVLRLRRKLEIDPTAPRAIHTDRGFGYSFALPVERL
jgi:two-component system, OmpR family, response regulator